MSSMMFAPYMAEFEGSVGARRHAPYAPQLWQRAEDLDKRIEHVRKFEQRKSQHEFKKMEARDASTHCFAHGFLISVVQQTEAWSHAIDDIYGKAEHDPSPPMEAMPRCPSPCL